MKSTKLRPLQTTLFRTSDYALWVGLLITLLSLFLKLRQVLLYPTIPVSDFQRIVEFATEFAHNGLTPHTWHWLLAAPGTPVALALPLALIDGDPVTIARWASLTAMATLPLLPLLMLRGVIPGWARVIATGLIAFLPAQIVFASVPAQDTWVQLPVLALACLAVRNVRGNGLGEPRWAAVLWCWSVYTRPEMLVAALPLAVAAMMPWRAITRSRLRAFAWFASVSLALLSGIIVQRGLATGRYSLTSPHGGSSILGAYVPGVGFGWTQPEPWVATFSPELADNPEKMMDEASRLAWQEIKRRPFFHFQRRIGALLYAGTASDGTITYWTLLDTAQAPVNSQAAAEYSVKTDPWIRWGFVLLHALFIAAICIGVRRRDPILLTIAVAVVIKLGIHLLFASQARFFLVIGALEAVAIALAAVDVVFHRPLRVLAIGSSAVAAIGLGGGMVALPAWEAALDDPAPNVVQRFMLRGDVAQARCQLAAGRLLHQSASTFGFQVQNADPAPGEVARVQCNLEAVGNGGTVVISVQDRYAPGGFPDRLVQQVWLNKRRLLRNDVAAEAWSGWWDYPLRVAPGENIQLVFEVVAVRPDAGPAWGNAAATDVQLKQ